MTGRVTRLAVTRHSSVAHAPTLVDTIRSMTRREGTLRMLPTLVLAFLVNAVLDVAFDLPMLVRWSIAATVVVVAVALIEVRRRRAGADST